MHPKALHELALIKNYGTKGFWPHADLRNSHAAKVFNHAGYGYKLTQSLCEFFFDHATSINIAEGHAVTQHLLSNGEYAALTIRMS